MDPTARFQDNSSPEPSTGMTNPNCFQTPDINTFNGFNYLYPTPPSDNENNSYMSLPHAITQPDTNYMTTPKFTGQYYMNSSPESTYTSSPEYAKNTPYQSVDQMFSSPESVSSGESNIAIVPKQHVDVSSSQTGSRFKRRSRTTFSKSQLDVLEKTFQKSQYPEIKVVDDLCDMLGLSTERISIWFQNRRARFKKARKLQAQSSGYASTAPHKSTGSSDSAAAAVCSNDYSYNPGMYANLYAGQAQIYSDQVAIQKVDTYALNDTASNESVGSSQAVQGVTNQQFYPQK